MNSFDPTTENLAAALRLLSGYTDIKQLDAAIRKLARVKYPVGFYGELEPLNAFISLARAKPESYEKLYGIALARMHDKESPSVRQRREYMRTYMQGRRQGEKAKPRRKSR